MINQNENSLKSFLNQCEFPLNSSSRKKKRIEYPLNQNQIIELSNLSNQGRVLKYIKKNHLLVQIISNRGFFEPHTLIGLYPDFIQNYIKTQYSLPSDIHLISNSDKKQANSEICYHAQHLFLNSIIKVHHEYMEHLKSETSSQKKEMSKIHFDVVSCDCKSHFRYYISKRKRKSLFKKNTINKKEEELIEKQKNEK